MARRSGAQQSTAGSLYWLGLRDREGIYRDGAQHDKLTVPLPVPGKLFWSVTVYDADTRSQIQTPQKKAALRSLFVDGPDGPAFDGSWKPGDFGKV